MEVSSQILASGALFLVKRSPFWDWFRVWMDLREDLDVAANSKVPVPAWNWNLALQLVASHLTPADEYRNAIRR